MQLLPRTKEGSEARRAAGAGGTACLGGNRGVRGAEAKPREGGRNHARGLGGGGERGGDNRRRR
jgi:hypothetical protein